MHLFQISLVLSNKIPSDLSVLRFVDKDFQIREEFLDFQCTDRINGEVISGLILGKREQWGLKIEDCRVQGYDGASNMSSQVRGVQGLISQKNSKALYVHCNSHVLNLVIVKACSLPTIRSMAGTITERDLKFFQLLPEAAKVLRKCNKHRSTRFPPKQDP